MKHAYNPVGSTLGPHIRERWTSQWIMSQVLIALCFPTISAIFYFGWYTVVMIVFSILMCTFLEYITNKFLNKKNSLQDRSAIVTGWLLALMLPVTTPIWIILIGDIIAIVFIKEISGGLGKNWLNPAVASRVLLKLLFTPWITNWVLPGPDVITTATPLSELGHFSHHVSNNVPEIWKLFLGLELGGPIGETNKLALLISLVYLVTKKVIDIRVPLYTLASFFSIILIYSGFDLNFSISHLLSGSLVFAAVFMVTDYTTTPMTYSGKYIFATSCGILCAILRIVLDLPGGIGVAIITMNFFTPIINKWSTNKIYGEEL